MECITIYTDASIDIPTGYAGWGAWIKYGNNSSFTLSTWVFNTNKVLSNGENSLK